MKQRLARLRGAMLTAGPAIARDVVGLAGAAAIVTGVGMIAAAAAWIVAGVMLIGVAVLLALKTG